VLALAGLQAPPAVGRAAACPARRSRPPAWSRRSRRPTGGCATVETLRRKLIELASHGRGAALQAALANAHAQAQPQALGFLYVDGQVQVYSGARELPKTDIARMMSTSRPSSAC